MKFKRNSFKSIISEYYQLYLILIPAIIFFIVFSYIPMYGLTLAFRDYKFNKGLFFSPWIGFDYFIAFFSHYNFWTLIKNTLVINFFRLFLFFPIPIIFALMLNELKNKHFKSFVQTVSYLPYFISWVIAVAIVQQFISLDGVVNQVRESLGLEKIFFMNDSSYFYPIMFFSYVWKNAGWSSILYLAALAGIDPGLYESATIDGAGRFRKMWNISIPSIAPTIAVLFILGLSSILSAGWDQIYLLRTPGNMQISDIIDTYIIQEGLRGGQFGYATAVSVFQSAIGLLLVLVTNKIVKSTSDTSIF